MKTLRRTFRVAIIACLLVAFLVTFRTLLLALHQGRKSDGSGFTNPAARPDGEPDVSILALTDSSEERVRPGITDHLPPGYEILYMENGGVKLTVPAKGIFLACGVSVASRGLVFKGPIAFAASEDGPWIGYTDSSTSMFVAKDGTTKLTGASALIPDEPLSETQPDPDSDLHPDNQ